MAASETYISGKSVRKAFREALQASGQTESTAPALNGCVLSHVVWTWAFWFLVSAYCFTLPTDRNTRLYST